MTSVVVLVGLMEVEFTPIYGSIFCDASNLPSEADTKVKGRSFPIAVKHSPGMAGYSNRWPAYDVSVPV